MSAAMTNQTQLKVGGIYRHSTDASDELTLFTIIERWSPDLFLGAHYDPKEKCQTGGTRWMFNSFGNALGYADNQGSALHWSIVEYYPDPNYEVMCLFNDDSHGDWESINRNSPWTYDTMYVVREESKLETSRLMDHETFCSFVTDLFEEQN